MKFNLNKFLLEDIESTEQPSEFITTKEFDILVLRLPYIKNGAIEIYSYPFLIKDKVFLFNRRKDDFELIGNLNDLHKYLDIRIDKLLNKLSKFHIEIAKMEDNLYEGQNIDMKEWLILKKDIGSIERVVSHSELAFERFLRKYRDKIDEFAFNDLKEHLNRVLRLAISGNTKLDYIYDFYRNFVDEKMNNIMFVLTVLSAIFMPLTLVTGFFGMNTGGLPYINDENGTIKVIILSFIFEIPFVIWIYKLIKRN